MNIQFSVHMDKPAFLNWVQGREGRYELVGGRVVVMVGATRAHGRLVRNLVLLLCGQLDPKQWEVIAEFGLDTGPESFRFPDIVVDRAGGYGGDYRATAPVLLVEILSPSSAAIDLEDKAREHLRLPSLLDYLVFSQREHKVWIWSRDKDGSVSGPHEIAGVDRIIHIAELHLQLPMAAVYLGVDEGWRTERSG